MDLSGIIYMVIIACIIAMGIAFQRAADEARAERKILEVDISDCPPFLPEDDTGEPAHRQGH